MGILGWGGRYLFYFYCHGEMEGHVFKLKLEPAGRPGYISAADLDRRWSGLLVTCVPLQKIHDADRWAASAQAQLSAPLRRPRPCAG